MAAYKNKVRVAAHRGNSCVCPENTLVAMRSALELPVDMLEIDLHMTKDGHIILMHDLSASSIAAALQVVDRPDSRLHAGADPRHGRGQLEGRGVSGRAGAAV